MEFNRSIKVSLLFAIAVTSLFVSPGAGQKNVTLKEAVDIALVNNLKVKSAKLKEKYRQAMVNTSAAMQPLSVSTTLGQFNSAYFDTGIGLSQTFLLPKVYRVKKEAGLADVRTAEFLTNLTGAQLKRELEDHFDVFGMLQARKILLVQLDSIYSAMEAKAKVRWEKGESDILEHLTARRQRDEVRRQLELLSGESAALLISFNLLLNAPEGQYQPEVGDYRPVAVDIPVTDGWLAGHPEVLLAEEEWKAGVARTSVEKAARLPGITAGYQNLSIRGTGADNKVYTAAHRFSNFQLGVSVPIFRKGINAGIEASRAAEDILSNQLETTRNQIAGDYNKCLDLYRVAYRSLLEYEQGSLRDAATIMQVSSQRLASGAINYLEYVQLTTLATDIRARHIDLIRTVNTNAVRLHYLTNQFKF